MRDNACGDPEPTAASPNCTRQRWGAGPAELIQVSQATKGRRAGPRERPHGNHVRCAQASCRPWAVQEVLYAWHLLCHTNPAGMLQWKPRDVGARTFRAMVGEKKHCQPPTERWEHRFAEDCELRRDPCPGQLTRSSLRLPWAFPIKQNKTPAGATIPNIFENHSKERDNTRVCSLIGGAEVEAHGCGRFWLGF